MNAMTTCTRLILVLLVAAALCADAQEVRQGQGGTTYSMKEMRVWAQDLFARRHYYAKGDMQASLGANNRWSPGDGARIQQQADAFRTNAATRASVHYASARLAVSATGVVIKGSGGEPHQQGKHLRDCAFVSACHRALGDGANANVYAAPVIAELLAHARQPLLDFAGRSVPGRSGYRWPVQQSDYLSSGSNPGFALAEWGQRLFVGYDYVRPLMSAADRSVMDAWFLGFARWVAHQVDIEQDKYYGNGSSDRRSGDQPYFERFTDAAASLTVRTDYGNQLPLYAGGPLCGGFKRYAYTNRHLTSSSFAYLIGLDRGDQALIRTGEFYYKETLCFGVFPTGEHVDMTRSFTDATPTSAFAGGSETGFNYFMSVVGRLVLMAEWSTRAGRGLATYGTTKGAYGTTNGSTRKDLLLMCRRAASYFDSAANPRKYASVTATTNPALLIDGINPALSPGEVVSDSWLAGINIVFKDQGLRAAYQRTASTTRPYPEWPLGVGPNQPWSAHSEAIPGTLFMYAGREGNEASDYSLTSRIQGLRVTGVGGNTVALAWTQPSASDDRCTAIELERATSSSGPFAVIARLSGGNPLSLSSYTASGLASATTYWFRLRGQSVVGWSGYTGAVQAATTAGSPPPILPGGWSSVAIGTATPGTASESGGTWTISGSGTDIWNASDGFRFVTQQVTGDVRIIARVTAISNTDAWAKAGVMIRESNAAAARHAFTCLTPGNGIAFQRRLSAGAISYHTAGPRVPAPYWVRLERIGDVLIGSSSADGATWTEIRRDTVDLPATALVGLAVTSHADGVLCTATFTNVQITAAPAAAN